MSEPEKVYAYGDRFWNPNVKKIKREAKKPRKKPPLTSVYVLLKNHAHTHTH